ncbi:MAG: cytochrome c4 [Alphaproteobacteria bacterium]|nr:cytochrome c4 [Alphaproteobacteria bacterium]MBF0391768.1 cytochrome c4 [Alphaproteobacteria bacterium]
MLSNACAGCHGTDGTSAGPATPTIANLSVEYFVEMMKGYKAGTRPSTVMARIAKGYSDEEIQAMAGYFQQRPFGRPEQVVDAAKVKTGKSLAKKYCESCHEDEGKVGEGVGVLAGQKLPYMQYSVSDFLDGKRQMEKRQAKKFEELKADHGDAGFEAVLNYYAGVK